MITAARRQELEEFIHERIPLTRAMDVQVEGEDAQGLTLTAPLDKNHNHLGTAFGGSLAALMMLTGYAFLWLELDNPDAHVVISKSRIKFCNPVRSTLRAVCAWPRPKELDAFHAAFAAQGRAKIALEVRIEQNRQTAAILEGVYVAFASAIQQER